MLVNDQTVVITVTESDAATPGFVYGRETSQNFTDWEQRREQLHVSTVIADRVYNLLGNLRDILGVAENAVLRSAVTIPRYNAAKTMTAFVSRDSRTGSFYSNTHMDFT